MLNFLIQARWAGKQAPEILDADEATWPFNTDSPVLQDVVRQDRTLSIMLVNLCGLDWVEIEPLLPVARAGAREQDMLPVIIVDMTDVVPLRSTSLAYDVLPSVRANSPILPELDWRAYFARRKALLIEKWQPEAIVHLGSDQDW
ncbi:hypothetical protein [Roseibium album]|uniref:hypothetical protein n=1 Tax=Roseibium album TaxID=311410 RepID=UPI0032968EB3